MLATKDETILTKNVTGAGGTRINREKYEIVRKAILSSIPRGRAGVLFKDLPKLVTRRVPGERFEKKGSVSWYVTTVKLDLEARGFIERIEGESPQRLRRR